jgi:DNA-binding LytR/AlgR family response regulator
VGEAVEWFLHNPAPDLVLMDIHLSDGNSFSIFDRVQVKCPIIFTTAHGEYALQAFKVNCLDYLIKPVSFQGLAHSMQKWQLWANHTSYPNEWKGSLPIYPYPQKKPYKSRFLVRFGDRLQFKPTSEIAYFYADGKITYLVSADNRRCIVDYTLEQLETLLDPDCFFG